jgi:hypothetical protein
MMNPPQANLPPIAAQVQAPVMPLLAPPPRMCTFSQFYSDEKNDPCKRSYNRVMTRFEAGRVGAPTAVALHSQVVGIGSQAAQAYLCCGQTPNGACTHFPSKYVASLEGDATAWDDLSFAFLGDPVRGTITNVLFPNEVFEIHTAWVPSLNYILDHLDELDDAPVFPPVDHNDVYAEKITTRKFMYLLAVYAPLLISSSGYTLKQIWTRLYPAMMQ